RTERRIPPSEVHRVFRGPAQPSERRHIAVLDARLRETLLESPLLELRVVPRLRHGADIDERVDVVTAEQPYEVLDRARRMADGVHDLLSHQSRSAANAASPSPANR